MYLSRELTDSSLPKIGKEFGGRDHTTVIHATSKIARLIREDRSVYNLVQELTARMKQARYPDACSQPSFLPRPSPQPEWLHTCPLAALFPASHTAYHYNSSSKE